MVSTMIYAAAALSAALVALWVRMAERQVAPLPVVTGTGAPSAAQHAFAHAAPTVTRRTADRKADGRFRPRGRRL